MDDDGNTWIYQLDKSLEDKKAWVNRLKKRVQETEWRCHRCTIYKVPPRLRMVDPIAYEPSILSLGPYHFGKPHLSAMDQLKWHYLKNFVRRNPERGLEDYLELVASMEAGTREAYSEAPQMDSKDWVEMMLLDSCFTLELLLLILHGRVESDEGMDPILRTSWVAPHLIGDMLLLENQLPFFLLEKQLELNSSSRTNSPSLSTIVLKVFVDLMPGKVQTSSLNYIGNIHHILHLLYFCTLPNDPATQGHRSRGLARRSRSRNSSSIIVSDEPALLQWVASAKNLKNAGVSFRKKTKNATSFLDITFRKGTLEIPPLQISGKSNAIFRNLIAFEQCHMGNSSPTDLTAYASFMDCIIDTSADVDLLRQDGIIVSTLGNDDDVARFFNRLRTNAAIDENSYLSGVFEDVQRHCNKSRNRWKATLNHNFTSTIPGPSSRSSLLCFSSCSPSHRPCSPSSAISGRDRRSLIRLRHQNWTSQGCILVDLNKQSDD